MRRLALLLPFLCLFDASADGVPVAPLSPRKTETGTAVFHLHNDELNVKIQSDNGGVVSIRHRNGNNLLSSPLHILPTDPDGLEPAFPRIENIQVPRWQARGWLTADGASVVMLTQSFGHPFHLRQTHLITLPHDHASLVWNTRMTAQAPPETDWTPRAQWSPAHQPDAYWVSIPDHAHPDCGSWMQRDTPPDAFTTSTLATKQSNLMLRWDSAWRLEDRPGLLPATITASANQSLPTLECRPSLPEDLPPQGWTLVHTLRLTLLPLGDEQSPCDVLN